MTSEIPFTWSHGCTENNSTRVQRVKPAAGGYTYPPPNLTLYQRVRLPAYRRLSTRVYCVPNPHRMGTQPTHRRQPTRSQRVHNPHMAYYLRCVGWELAFCEYKYPLVGCPNQLEGKVPSSGGVQGGKRRQPAGIRTRYL